MSFFGNTYRALRLLPWVVGAGAGVLYAVAMPGFDLAEAVWVWAIPFILWAASTPRWKTWLIASVGAMWGAQIVTLIWLRHVYPPLGWLGLVFLTAAVAAFPVAWLALLRWIFPRTVRASLMGRMIAQLGLAGAWVTLEWVRSWILTGFPWGLLAETQWQRPSMLMLCSWGGPWAISFAVILFNIGLARYILRFFEDRERAQSELLKARHSGAGAELAPALFPSPTGFLRKICPEFYIGFLPLFAALFFFLRDVRNFHSQAENLFTLGVVQTDFDPNAKWDESRLREHRGIVRDLTLAASRLSRKTPVFDARTGTLPPAPPSGVPRTDAPTLILWPEAALPYSTDNDGYKRFLAELSAETEATLLIGGVCHEGTGYYNGVFTVTPTGVGKDYYAKRHLVPFGEYVPFADILPLRKIVPIAHDSLVGLRDVPLPVPVTHGGRTTRFNAGALVCYEDVFPDMGLDLARRGADFLVVVTNDAWYGREAGAHQHAAHSIVMAAGLRMPVLRCGNNGWSGVINPIGQATALADTAGSIYFRGAGRFDVKVLPAALRKPSFYVRYGNWLVEFSAMLTLWACLRYRRWRAKPGRVSKSEETSEHCKKEGGDK
ncbi:MAG: apolipoprotein N-acyltransferase [Puniceicoccales bacterium]|jgi:apolipoprotein N-acyltransferase|nr:apolipoprotein N-acyltransferase [Puniceicoccales bacterium]